MNIDGQISNRCWSNRSFRTRHGLSGTAPPCAAIWRGLTDPDSFVRNTTAFVLSGSGLKEARGLLLKAKAELAKRPDKRPDLFDRAIERTENTGIR